MRKRFTIEGMSCAACQAGVEKTLKKLKGVKQYRVNLLKAYADIEFQESKLSEAELCASLKKAGYPAAPAADQPQKISFQKSDSEEADLPTGECPLSLEDVISNNQDLDSAAELQSSPSQDRVDQADQADQAEPAEDQVDPEKVADQVEAGADLEKDTEPVEASIEPESQADQAEPAEDQNKLEDFAEVDRQAELMRKRRKNLHDPLVKAQAGLKSRLIYSFILLLPLVYFMLEMIPGINLPLPAFMQGELGAANRAFSQLLFTAPILSLNKSFFSSGFRGLIKRKPNMDSLVAIGAGSAFVYGIFAIFKLNWGLMLGDNAILTTYQSQLYLDSAAMIVTLISLGKYFELRAKRKTTVAVESLLDLAPAACTVIQDGRQVRLPAADVAVGSEVILLPGERVALDGIIVKGASSFDEQALSGESMPVDKGVGEKVFAGTLNQTGAITYRTLKPENDTILARIVNLVEDAAASKAKIARLADRVSGIFVPVVIAIALVTFLVWQLSGAGFEWSMSMAISVLLISCPCALGLATPVAMMVASGRAAQEGILIKGADSLERVNEVTDLVMDKTGTVTEGRPEIVAIEPHPGSDLSERDLLELAASIEARSEHPLAKAVLVKAKEVGIEPWPQEAGEALPGRGVYAKLFGRNYFAGNLSLLAEAGLSSEEVELLTLREAEQGRSALLVFAEDQYLGLLSASDQVKAEARTTLASLGQSGLDLLLLTGDHKQAAKAIGRRLELSEDNIVAEVLPHEKAEVIKQLQAKHKVVAMMGDGINDAPALVTADLGIAVGAGTDIAIESADVVLMRSDLRDVITFFELGKKTLRIMKQNLFWAFFYNVLGIPLAAGLLYPTFGLKLNPIYAALAMSLSSIFVISNALRLRKFVPKWQKHQAKLDQEEGGEAKLDLSFKQGRKTKQKMGKFLEAAGPKTQIIEGVVAAEKYSAELTQAELDHLASMVKAEEAETEIKVEAETVAESPKDLAETSAKSDLVEEPDQHSEEKADQAMAESKPRQEAADSEDQVEVKQTEKLDLGPDNLKSARTKPENIWQSIYEEVTDLDQVSDHFQIKLKLEGMKCQNCVAKVEVALKQLDGVESVSVDLDKKEASLSSRASLSELEITAAVKAAGFKVRYFVVPR